MTTITATLPSGQTATLDIDAVVAEHFAFPAKVTEHPVEQGSNVTDNIRAEADKWNLECIVTNSPLPPFAGDAQTRAEDAIATLRSWQSQGALLSIPTTLGLLTSMAVANVSGTRDAKTGGQPASAGPGSGTGGVRFTLSVTNIRIVQNKLTNIAITKTKNTLPKVRGGYGPGEVPFGPPIPAESTLHTLIGTSSPAAALAAAQQSYFGPPVVAP